LLLKVVLQLSVVLILSLTPYQAHCELWMTEWSAEYKAYLSRIGADPAPVLQQLLAEPPGQSFNTLQQAQYHYSLSHAYYVLSFPQQALEHSRLALSSIKDEQQPWLFHSIRLAESMALDIVGKPREGMLAANAALIWAELQNDKNLITSALYTRGNLLNSLVDYAAALRDFLRAYELALDASIVISKGQVAGMLALVYEYRGEDAQAIPFFEEAVTHQRHMQNWIELSIALYGLGRANKNVGNLELGRSQLEESLALAQQVKDIQGVGYALKELSGLDIIELNYPAAEQKLLQAKDIFAQSEHRYLQLDVAIQLSYLARLQNMPTLAEKYLQMANDYIDPKSMPVQQLSLDEEQAHVFAAQGDFSKAYQHLAATVVARKKLNSRQSIEQLHQLRSRYELEVKERENKLLEQENQLQKSSLTMQDNRNRQLMMLAAFSALLCLLLVIIVYRTKKHRARLENLANTDGLTGLINRRKTLEMLGLQIELANRHELALSVAMVDMDNFKQVNDKYGHATGDKVLIEFSRLCRDTFRHTDIVGRIGGEEFLIVLPHTDKNSAQITLEGLRLATQELVALIDIDGLSISISCGLCQHRGQMTVETILAQVDSALYDAKDLGRNRIRMAKLPDENETLLA
jgi:diguanylate cyclase (GGDEF)-like protein